MSFWRVGTSINDVPRFLAFFDLPTYLCPILSLLEKAAYLMTSFFVWPTLPILFDVVAQCSTYLPTQNRDVINGCSLTDYCTPNYHFLMTKYYFHFSQRTLINFKHFCVKIKILSCKVAKLMTVALKAFVINEI